MFDISSASIHGLMPLKLHEATFADFLAFLRFLTHILNFMTVLVSHGKIWPHMKDIGLLHLYLNQILHYLSYVSHLFVVKSQIATLWVTQLIQFYRILSKTVSILNS